MQIQKKISTERAMFTLSVLNLLIVKKRKLKLYCRQPSVFNKLLQYCFLPDS